MSQREPIKVIADIIQEELELDDGQVMLAYEKFDIPQDEKIYIALSYISGKAIGNNNYYDDETDEEIQQMTVRHLIQIDALSFGNEARARKEEIVMALHSVFAENQQQKNNLQIARTGGEFLNASSLEETKFLNRFTTTIAVTSLQTKRKPVEFYDTFPTPKVVVNL